MIHYKKKSNAGKGLVQKFTNHPYLVINTFFAGAIVLILAYSGIFSPDGNNYPLMCLHEKLSGEPCFSCGLSHSFSLIVRGRIDEAYQWNHYGMRVFLFFASQLILRVVFSVYYMRYVNARRQLIVIDSVGSGLIFLVSFWPFIFSILSGTLSRAC